MPSVTALFSADFRAGLSQSQNPAPEGDDTFSDLLHSIADAKNARRPDGMARGQERRADAPASPPKPEADPERNAKRRAPEAAETDASAADTPASAGPVVPVDGEQEGEANTDNADADALLMLGLVQTQQDVPVVAQSADVDVPAVVAAVAEGEPEEIEAVTPAAATEAEESMPAAAAPVPFKARLQAVVMAGNAEADPEVTLPKISAEPTPLRAQPLPAGIVPEGEMEIRAQPATVSAAQAPAAQNSAPLEMLNAAISKHAQLAFGAERNEAKPEAEKPLLSSNAVAPNFAMTTQANANASVTTAQAPAVAESARAVPVAQLAVEIATRASKGERRFDIRLDPPELGRIDVRLEIDSKGNTTTKLIVERAETLDMLQRDARGLEKALQNAGLKLDSGSMQFSLQQDAQMQQGQHNHAAEMRGRAQSMTAETETITEIATGNAALAAQLRGGVDIRI